MSELNYNDETHTYTYEGEIIKSVTEIASEICNLNPKYFSAKAAATGTDVHTELARYYDPKDSFGSADFTIDTAAKMALFLKAKPTFLTEVIVHNKEYNYAGTIDLVSIVGDKVFEIVDFKSGNVNRKYCTVQLSLYKLALESMGYDCSDTRCRVISPSGITKIEPLSWDAVWNLAPSDLDATYSVSRIEKELKKLWPYYQQYKQLEEKFRAMVLEELVSAGATKYSGELFDVSYVAPSVRVGLDTTRLKAEHPEIYEAYIKETNVSGSVKLTSKKEN